MWGGGGGGGSACVCGCMTRTSKKLERCVRTFPLMVPDPQRSPGFMLQPVML